MKKRYYIILAFVLIIISLVYNIAVGNRYVMETDLTDYSGDVGSLIVTIENDENTSDREIIRIADTQTSDGKLFVVLESVSSGKAWVDITEKNDPDILLGTDKVFVHQSGIITESDFFGRSTGGWIVPVAIIIFLAALITGLLVHIIKELKRDLYQYKNVRNIGFVIFIIFFFVEQLLMLRNLNDGIIGSVNLLLESASSFSVIVLPVAFITFILVTISNIKLMRNEGPGWKNMLGCILGIMVCLGTIFPSVLGDFLQQTTLVDVHNQNGTDLYIEMFVENIVVAITAYLECVLMGTIILSTKAAKRIPAFDKDYILILGCQIKKDGTLTNLLKGRADRAIEFAKMQEEASGKDIVFIPSGGKGDDEIISEAEAIRNYLVETGIDESCILVENKSANTFENLRNSMELIRKDGKADDPKIAFSTTNYHVFRSGVFASQQGIRADGIGAKTKRYFWINAFIREFIAALVSEWKIHFAIIFSWIVLITMMIGIVYFSNNL